VNKNFNVNASCTVQDILEEINSIKPDEVDQQLNHLIEQAKEQARAQRQAPQRNEGTAPILKG